MWGNRYLIGEMTCTFTNLTFSNIYVYPTVKNLYVDDISSYKLMHLAERINTESVFTKYSAECSILFLLWLGSEQYSVSFHCYFTSTKTILVFGRVNEGTLENMVDGTWT